jgi:hypothetical protein
MIFTKPYLPYSLLTTIVLVNPVIAAASQPPAAKPKPNEPIEIAAEFLKLVFAAEDADALKCVAFGSVSANKIAEIRRAGYSREGFALVLINDTRVEVVTKEKHPRKAGEPEGHLVIMVVKGKDGAWRVKDIDIRDTGELKSRIDLYLAGRYNEKSKQ